MRVDVALCLVKSTSTIHVQLSMVQCMHPLAVPHVPQRGVHVVQLLAAAGHKCVIGREVTDKILALAINLHIMACGAHGCAWAVRMGRCTSRAASCLLPGHRL